MTRLLFEAVNGFQIAVVVLHTMGSPHGHWNGIHWIRIPGTDSKWSRVSSTRHEDCAHCTAGLDPMLCPTQHSTQLRSGSRLCGGKVVFGSGSPIHIRSRSKVLCGESHCHKSQSCKLRILPQFQIAYRTKALLFWENLRSSLFKLSLVKTNQQRNNKIKEN